MGYKVDFMQSKEILGLENFSPILRIFKWSFFLYLQHFSKPSKFSVKFSQLILRNSWHPSYERDLAKFWRNLVHLIRWFPSSNCWPSQAPLLSMIIPFTGYCSKKLPTKQTISSKYQLNVQHGDALDLLLLTPF